MERRVHEAEDLVRQFVDDASLQDLANVRIIHGAGTGALREAIRELLAKHPLGGIVQCGSSRSWRERRDAR